jgi:hypothetical protein
MPAPPSRDRPAPLALVLVVPVAAALALALFLFPTTRIGPRDMPVGVAGPAPAAGAAQKKLTRQPRAFDVHRYQDRSAAEHAIRDRKIYGALVVGAGKPVLLTASAGGVQAAQAFQKAAAKAAPQPPKAVDLVPAPKDDPRGVALGAAVLPLVLAGVIAATVSGAIEPAGVRRAALVMVGAALSGLGAVLVSQSWLGALRGPWLLNAGVLALMVLAIAAVLSGLQELLGDAGFIGGIVAMVLAGNALSGLTSSPELLRRPFGTIGQLLPPGAGGSLLRSTAFFGRAGSEAPLLVLTGWSLLGLLVLTAANRRQRRLQGSAA